jgi:diaminohydroxyphosphoribosylaminopyrimidine deaminase/5-amino-6-(5-phosphoribosylamino)uracil reductase
MGLRDLDPASRVLDSAVAHGAESVQLRTHEPLEALCELYARGRQHVFLEGGPTLAAAFLRAGLVDEVVAYVSPMLLGSGRNAVADLGITTIADALRPTVTDVTVLPGLDGEQPNVRITMTPTEGA